MIKRRYIHISGESLVYQKKIAVKMWQFVKKWYVKHPDTYMHPVWIKEKFCCEYVDKTGQHIDWEAACILCEKFHDEGCYGCPLHSDNEEDRFCEDYFKLSDADFPFHMRPAICDKIIEAIKSFEG